VQQTAPILTTPTKKVNGLSIYTRRGVPYARILGLGGYRPQRVVRNAEFVDSINSSDEWIRVRSHIIERRWAGPDESLIDMAVAAGAKALAAAELDAGQLGCVLVATITHLKQTPSAAVEVAHRLGATHAAAYDISAACAGFCYALTIAADHVKGGSATYVLVVGADRMTDIIDPADRTTAFLFADGAGAAVVGPSRTVGIGPVVWGADGSRVEAITQDFAWDRLRDHPDTPWPAMRMQGREVYRWATTDLPQVAEQTLAAAGVSADKLDAFVPHQANGRIIDLLAKTLGLPDHVVIARDLTETGNTSSASIPLAMERLMESGDVPPDGLALLIGFGAGLTFAGQVVRFPKKRLAAPSRLEILECAREAIGRSAPTEVAAIDLDTAFADLDVDSLFMAQVLTEMEERLGIRIPDESVRDVRTVRDLIDQIAPEGVV
jgi:3-oxoacyl-[acyl-carrier-protein] synthase-3